VTLTLSAGDTMSGVAARMYTIDGSDPATLAGPAFAVSGNGEHSVTYWATDIAGNIETSRSATVRILGTSPGVAFGSLPASWVSTAAVSVSILASSPAGIDRDHVRGRRWCRKHLQRTFRRHRRGHDHALCPGTVRRRHLE